MQWSLALTALLMGLVGGPHCVAMCGAACGGIARAAGPRSNTALLGFQLGRVLGYSVLGGMAAVSMEGLGWLTVQSAALRPVWTQEMSQRPASLRAFLHQRNLPGPNPWRGQGGPRG